jgi:hypothetical protein
LTPGFLPCEICADASGMELPAVEDRDSRSETPGQRSSEAEILITIPHCSLKPVGLLTVAVCCPFAAWLGDEALVRDAPDARL